MTDEFRTPINYLSPILTKLAIFSTRSTYYSLPQHNIRIHSDENFQIAKITNLELPDASYLELTSLGRYQPTYDFQAYYFIRLTAFKRKWDQEEDVDINASDIEEEKENSALLD